MGDQVFVDCSAFAAKTQVGLVILGDAFSADGVHQVLLVDFGHVMFVGSSFVTRHCWGKSIDAAVMTLSFKHPLLCILMKPHTILTFLRPR